MENDKSKLNLPELAAPERVASLALPELEEEILKFWENNKIFEKSVTRRSGARRFVFYDGPPFASGLPHYGHILASTVKDVVPRYWTMRGFRVDRRWGWDCHGLPIEHLVEQELKISGRKTIEKFGIKKFNEAARSKVLTYANEWHKTVQRIGRFVDFENSYKTMDATYMESVWWAFAALYKKGLVYKDSRTSLFCPRCETPLSNFEIAMDNSYRDEEDDSVYVKLPVEGTKKEFLLIWTTTPWTLPGNAAVAINPKIEYTKFGIGGEYIWAAVPPPHEAGEKVTVIEKRAGKSLLGIRYVPPFRLADDKTTYRVVGADFVDISEGTGLVHIAPAFGEEDFILGRKENLPTFATLDDAGRFGDQYPALNFLRGKKADEANSIIIEWLKERHFLWKIQRITHRYPICWRCQTPLLYKVQPSWFIKIEAIKPKMLALNEKIDWHPEHLKHGRFGNGIKDAPDWNVSRSRFWGTPMPIWECVKCKKIHVIGHREDFHKHSTVVKNRYLGMRHGESTTNTKRILARDGEHHLTSKGKSQVLKSAQKLRSEKIDLIVSSTVLRAKETAEMVARELDIAQVYFDERLNETNFGIYEGKSVEEYTQLSLKEMFYKAVPRGESLSNLRIRTLGALKNLEQKFSGKSILLVSHHDPLWMLSSTAMGLSNEEALVHVGAEENSIPLAGVLKIKYRHVPRNDFGELDFHRPYVDEVPIFCECGSEAKRIPDVFDCWFESGSMPFAQHHYPFENKNLFEKNFPADFIAEYIAQTRGWFHKLHVLAVALFGKPSFKHAVTTGIILSDKGEKLSKSRKNFPDPWLLFGRYGVDAIRYYLMASPIMRADNINFSEKDVDEVYKKYSLIARNVLNFFKLYSYRLKGATRSRGTSNHILDRWILSRLHSTIQKVTAAFDSYEITEATRPLFDFLQDLSLWYVRRSRTRIKSEGRDALSALTTLRSVLFDFSRLMAPITPFLAEIIYRDLGISRKLSVHLEDWPRVQKRFINKDLEDKMFEVREVASRVLRLRAEAGIKVRQPLASLQILNTKSKILKRELLDIIKEEVNVKEIIFGDTLKLDTKITPELKEEGIVREFVRTVQEMRRDLGLKPKDIVRIQIQGDRDIEKIISGREKVVKKDTNAKEIKIGGKKIFKIERELDFEGKSMWVGIGPV